MRTIFPLPDPMPATSDFFERKEERLLAAQDRRPLAEWKDDFIDPAWFDHELVVSRRTPEELDRLLSDPSYYPAIPKHFPTVMVLRRLNAIFAPAVSFGEPLPGDADPRTCFGPYEDFDDALAAELVQRRTWLVNGWRRSFSLDHLGAFDFDIQYDTPKGDRSERSTYYAGTGSHSAMPEHDHDEIAAMRWEFDEYGHDEAGHFHELQADASRAMGASALLLKPRSDGLVNWGLRVPLQGRAPRLADTMLGKYGSDDDFERYSGKIPNTVKSLDGLLRVIRHSVRTALGRAGKSRPLD